MSVLVRNNVTVTGDAERAMVFAHGYGCDQNMWRFVAPAFTSEYRVVLLDYVGAGGSDRAAYDRAKYSNLEGYAGDILEVCDELNIQGGVFVGHSVSTIIGILAAIREPERFHELVLIGPSPRYIDDEGYIGGFSHEDIAQLLEFQERNYVRWSNLLAEKVAGPAAPTEIVTELSNSFCQSDPEVARQFASVTFLSDNRSDLPRVSARALVIQCRDDMIAPLSVGEYVARNIPSSRMAILDVAGHSPHLTSPEQTVSVMKGFLQGH